MAGREGMMRPESSCAATPIAGRVRGGESGREGEEEEGEDETNTRPSILLWREEKGWRFEEQEEEEGGREE